MTMTNVQYYYIRPKDRSCENLDRKQVEKKRSCGQGLAGIIQLQIEETWGIRMRTESFI